MPISPTPAPERELGAPEAVDSTEAVSRLGETANGSDQGEGITRILREELTGVEHTQNESRQTDLGDGYVWCGGEHAADSVHRVIERDRVDGIFCRHRGEKVGDELSTAARADRRCLDTE
jgi:hypothetical protein